VSFYIFCGGDGLGKTTIAKILAALINVPYFKFPYGSDNDTEEEVYSGKRIRAILNDKENTCDPVAFQALQLINKLEAVSVLRELERKYGIVLVDRWSLSALIYGKVDGVDMVWNEKICKMFDDQIKPSIMFIFTGKSFKKDKDIYGEKQDTINRLYGEYLNKHRDGKNVIEINVTGKSKDAVALEVLGHIVRDVLKNKSQCEGTLSMSNVVFHANQTNVKCDADNMCKEPDLSKSCYDSMVI
jgi:thymidylate kinase